MGQPLETFEDPLLGVTWRELGAIRRAARLDDKWHVDLELGYPVVGIEPERQPRRHMCEPFVI